MKLVLSHWSISNWSNFSLSTLTDVQTAHNGRKPRRCAIALRRDALAPPIRSAQGRERAHCAGRRGGPAHAIGLLIARRSLPSDRPPHPLQADPMNDRFLKTGIFLAPFHPLHENPLLAIDRDMELLIHLDRLNYHEAWVGEHHSGGFEIIACPEMFIAEAAERKRHIRLGTGVV